LNVAAISQGERRSTSSASSLCKKRVGDGHGKGDERHLQLHNSTVVEDFWFVGMAVVQRTSHKNIDPVSPKR
jgi:hypothetical protein